MLGRHVFETLQPVRDLGVGYVLELALEGKVPVKVPRIVGEGARPGAFGLVREKKPYRLAIG
jgi:hypothetical protein